MKVINIKDIIYHNIDVSMVEVFAQSWINRDEFALYKSYPRPINAFLFVFTDITVTFYLENGQTVNGEKGDVIYIPKGARYYVKTEGKASGYDTYTVNFSISDNKSEILLSDSIIKIANKCAHFHKLADQLLETVYQTDGDRRNMARCKAVFYSMLDSIAGIDDERDGIYYLIREGVTALQNEWNKNIKIETYADMCGISQAYFYKCFRQWAGKSPVEYRNRMRLLNAETLLENTNMSVGDIAESVGFEDRFYFCRLFKKNYGISPQKYRKQIR